MSLRSFKGCLGVVLAVTMVAVQGKHVDLKACTDVFVGITVSSLVETTPPRQMELVWANADPHPSDFVGLYDDASLTHLLASVPVNAANGHGASGVAAPITVVDELTFQDVCLGYYVAYIRNSIQVLASGCLETYPRWMGDMRNELSQLKLNDVFLPGVHDAAAYRAFDGTPGNVVDRYSYTQEEEVLSQLVHGARYFDIRVAYRPNQSDVWWTNHGVNNLRPLQILIDQFKLFMDNTDEIVIFDVHGLAGFNNDSEIEDLFAAHLIAQFGAYAVPSSLTWTATLGAVWASGRRLVVTYPNDRVTAAHPELWPAVTHKWGDVNTVEKLHAYGVTVFSSTPPSRGWSFMAELTPTATDIALDRLGGLRQMADSVNQDVSTWFSLDWGSKANIVATDFSRGTTIVQEAIVWNMFRATGSPCRQNSIAAQKKKGEKKTEKETEKKGKKQSEKKKDKNTDKKVDKKVDTKVDKKSKNKKSHPST